MPPKTNTTLQHFLGLFLPLALLVSAGAFIYREQTRQARLENVMAREMAGVTREAGILETIIATRAADAAFLAARVAGELSQNHGEALAHVAEMLRSFAQIKTDYFQVRLLDAQGRESVRLDALPDGLRLTPEDELQDKNRSTYFRKAAAIPFGQVYVSALDLNRERGQVERPIRPTLRFASPVRGPDGASAGAVILNMDARLLLKRLSQATTPDALLLANSGGYWLLGPTMEQEWGFALPGRSAPTVEDAWPGAWTPIRSSTRGQFFLDGVLYTFDTVQADAPMLRQTVGIVPEESWLVVSRAVPGTLGGVPDLTFLAMTGGLLLMLALFTWIWALARSRRDLALRQLRRSEETARAILDAPQDAAFFLMELDGRILTANAVAEERFRPVTPGGLTGRSMWDIVPQDLAARRRDLFEFAARTGEPMRFDDERMGMILDNTIYPIRGEDGVTHRLAVLSRDVTAERQAQERLLTLSRAVEQSPAMVVITDAKGDIEYVNPSFTEKYGYSAEEVLGQNPRILKSGRHDAAFYQALWRTLAEGQDWVGEICNRTKDGRDIWEKASISPVLDETGQTTHYVAVKEDVTEQRRALRALAESEEKVRAMSEASQDGMVMIDDQGRVAFWNRAAERIFGHSRQEMLGQKLHSVVAMEEDAGKAREGFPDFSRTGAGAVVGVLTERTARRKDGSTFPAEFSVAAFRLQDRWWAVGTVRDITERKRAEELLLELATTDGLTGLTNRRHFLERGRAELERARRTGHPVSCIMFDVDHFKKVNDTYGHDAGDAVLKTLARTARETLRGMDVLGRIGGEEFAAILPETDLEAALHAAERLRLAVASMNVEHDGRPLPVTVSLGVALSSGPDESLDDLLRRADQALYEAKDSGRNRTVASGGGSAGS
ncbi:MAG: PAS domain S-box protein [Desulfovibrio aminophilus]|uniref:PAS domain S-box protein n=1 Tax=Desulfovibrio aminophilus TaxID=81425 RepID=UPI0039E7A4E7